MVPNQIYVRILPHTIMVQWKMAQAFNETIGLVFDPFSSGWYGLEENYFTSIQLQKKTQRFLDVFSDLPRWVMFKLCHVISVFFVEGNIQINLY